MKTLLTLLFCLLTLSLFSQEVHRETSTRKFEKPTSILISNISGDIEVEGSSGSAVELVVEKVITGKSATRLEQGKTEVNLGVQEENGKLILYMTDPCNRFQKYYDEDDNEEKWGYQWDKSCNWDPVYKYELNFKLKVPAGLDLKVSTVNHGEVIVSNLRGGTIEARNVNGGITLNSVEGKTRVHTINGDVDISYAKNPSSECSYYTLNGDINATFASNLSAELFFESYNGEFYTDLPFEKLPMQVTVESSTKNGLKYKIGGKSAIKVRNGGTRLDFETFNGDVYIREKG